MGLVMGVQDTAPRPGIIGFTLYCHAAANPTTCSPHLILIPMIEDVVILSQLMGVFHFG